MPRLSMTTLLRGSPVRLAPMAGLTNVPFRLAAVRCGSGFTTNEEIDADALSRGIATAESMMYNDPALGVVAMQLLGNSAETLVPAAHRLLEAGADIIDINMGCPVPKIVRRGKGAALMRDVAATGRMLTALRRELEVPLTIKIRGGWNDHETNAVEVAQMARDVGVDAITVHPRTRAQQFGGRAPWDVIRQVVEAVDIPVTGNGDVTSLEQARRMMAETGCAAVMVGRGALGRPWMFDAAYASLEGEARRAYEVREVLAHLDAIEAHFPPPLALVQMKKHLSQYSVGWPDCRPWRVELFACGSIAAVRAAYRRLVEHADEVEQTARGTEAAAGGTPGATATIVPAMSVGD